MPTPDCVSAVTGQVRHPETQLPQRGQSQEAKALWVVKCPAEPRCSQWTTRQKPRNWHHMGTYVDPIDTGELPPPSPPSFPHYSIHTERWKVTLSHPLAPCRNFQCFISVKLSAHWTWCSIKATGKINNLKHLLCLNPELPSRKRMFSTASSRRSGLSQTPASNPGERLGKGLTPLPDRHICKSNWAKRRPSPPARFRELPTHSPPEFRAVSAHMGHKSKHIWGRRLDLSGNKVPLFVYATFCSEVVLSQ